MGGTSTLNLVGGAALGAAFQLLFTLIYEATQKCVRFSLDLNRLNSTLSFISPVVHEIVALDEILDTPRHEAEALTARLIQGEKLVQKCFEVQRWNVVMRVYYSIKISKLEASLVSFFQVKVAALHFRESKMMAVRMCSLEEKVNEIIRMFNTIYVDRNISEVAELDEAEFNI